MKRSELKQIIKEVIEESTRTISTNKNNQFDIDLSDTNIIKIESFYYKDEALTEDEYLNDIILDLSLDDTKPLRIIATRTQFEVLGTTTSGQELYINQKAKDISKLFGEINFLQVALGSLFIQSGLKIPTITLDSVDKLEMVEHQFKKHGHKRILTFRTDLYKVK